jgi:hypothetical protein
LSPLLTLVDAGKASQEADKPMDVDPEQQNDDDDMLDVEECEAQDFLTKELVNFPQYHL